MVSLFGKALTLPNFAALASKGVVVFFGFGIFLFFVLFAHDLHYHSDMGVSKVSIPI